MEVRRDIIRRGYSKHQVEKSIQNRQNDFCEFVRPQREHADIVFSFGLSELATSFVDDVSIYLEINMSDEQIVFDKIPPKGEFLNRAQSYRKENEKDLIEYFRYCYGT